MNVNDLHFCSALLFQPEQLPVKAETDETQRPFAGLVAILLLSVAVFLIFELAIH